MRRVHEAAETYTPQDYENSDVLDDINRAKNGCTECFNFVDTFLDLFDFYIPYFVFIGIYLFKVEPRLVAAVLAIFFPVLINTLLKSKLFTELEKDITQQRRRYELYRDSVCDIRFFKETRYWGIKNFFLIKYHNALKAHNRAWRTAQKKSGIIELAMRLITLAGYAVVLLLVISTLLQNKITTGVFAAVFASINTFFIAMEHAVYRNLGNAFSNIGSVKYFISFVSRAKENGSKEEEMTSIRTIAFNDVCFSYDGKRNALDSVSFEIQSASVIAIVGENGAGKSTLAKLIAGIYKPCSGFIAINGKQADNEDCNCINRKSLQRRITAVFQNHKKYKMSLKVNTMISDTHVPADDKKIRHALQYADLNLNHFPYGLETVLSRDFDGIDVSGGEWQRIAIARGLYKSHDMLILDEPTSSIDPIKESELYKQFKELSNGKISFIITHRIGAARIADIIFVLDNGKLAEKGTHEQLLALGGKYKAMSEAQSRWYE